MSPSAQEVLVLVSIYSSVFPGQSLTDLVSNTKRLQHTSTEKQTKCQVQYMIDNSLIKDAACLRSLQGKGSGAWLDAIATSRKVAICPGLFHLAALMRSGLRLPLPQFIIECDCGKTLDTNGYHQSEQNIRKFLSGQAGLPKPHPFRPRPFYHILSLQTTLYFYYLTYIQNMTITRTTLRQHTYKAIIYCVTMK